MPTLDGISTPETGNNLVITLDIRASKAIQVIKATKKIRLFVIDSININASYFIKTKLFKG